MGFMDKIKATISKFKEDNKNFGSTMKRMNNKPAFYGNVNRGVKDGDFWEGSYLNIENGKGLIYGSSQDDYFFDSIASFEVCGEGRPIPTTRNVNGQSVRVNQPTLSCILSFEDGKKAKADILSEKLATFKMTFNI